MRSRSCVKPNNGYNDIMVIQVKTRTYTSHFSSTHKHGDLCVSITTAVTYQHLSPCRIPLQIPDQQPCADIEASCLSAVSCDSDQRRGGRKYESREDGCLPSRGPTQYFNHLTLSSVSSSHPRCPKQPAKIQRSFFSSHFHFPIYVLILFLLRMLLTLFPSPCPLSLLTLSPCVSTWNLWRQMWPQGYIYFGIYFPAKADLPPYNKDRSSFRRTARWRATQREMVCFSPEWAIINNFCTIVGLIKQWHHQVFVVQSISNSYLRHWVEISAWDQVRNKQSDKQTWC